MLIFIVGIGLFLGTHFYSAFRSRAPGKDAKERLGQAAFMGSYSLIALLGFGLMIWGYGRIPMGEPLYTPPFALRWVSAALLLTAFILTAASYLPAGRIKRATKHPMVTGVALWGLAHLLHGGALPAIILFASFFIFAVIDRLVWARRPDPDFSGKSSLLGDGIAITLGSALFFAFIHGLHAALFGVAPVLPL